MKFYQQRQPFLSETLGTNISTTIAYVLTSSCFELAYILHFRLFPIFLSSQLR
jgi:hypothetical protein